MWMVLGTKALWIRAAKSEQTNGLSNSDFHSKLQPFVPERDTIHEKLHCQILGLKITYYTRVSYFLFAILLFKGI